MITAESLQRVGKAGVWKNLRCATRPPQVRYDTFNTNRMPEKGSPMEQKYTPCPVYRKCGGCQLQNLDYQRQLRWKQDRCEKLLDEFGKIEPILGMEQPYHYRN